VFYSSTRKGALDRLQRARDENRQGILTLPTKFSVADLLRQWLTDTADTRSPSTQAVYANEVKRYLLPHLERLKLSEFGSLHVEQLQRTLSQKGLSGRSVLKARTILSAAMTWATRHRLIAINPVLVAASPRLEPIEKRTLSVVESRKFVSAVAGHRNEALYLVLLTLGIRRGEALGLKWDDIDWQSGQVTIRRQLQRLQDGGGLMLLEPKYSSRRTLYLPPFVLDRLSAHQERQITERELAGEKWQEHGLVFPSLYGTPMEPRNLQRDFAKLRAVVGIADLTLHGLRHSSISLYLAMGIPPHVVQAISGHADPNVTLAVYAHTQDADRRSAARAMGEALLTAK
jgi:integrase